MSHEPAPAGADASRAPLLSVIIPTRERADTLAFALATVLDQRTGAFEVVVTDNSSQDDTRAVVARIDDSRLRYVNTGRRISMTDNFEFGLQHARGRYLLFIGDDDGVMPGAIDRLAPRLEQAASLIFTWPRVVYRWPMGGLPAMATGVPPLACRDIDIRRLARFSMRMGAYRFERPPSVYYSAFHRSILDAVRARAGRAFPTSMPDIVSAFAAPAVTDRAVQLDFIVSVLGHCERSNGGRMGAGGEASGRAWTELFHEHGESPLHPTLLPDLPYRVNAIPDTLLRMKDLFPDTYGAVPFGYSEMWAYLYRLRDFLAWETSRSCIVRQARRIRQYQPFSVARFLAASAMHEALDLRRAIRRGRADATAFTAHPARTIADYVRSLAAAGAR